MSKGKIVFYDNEPQFTSQFEKIMKDGGGFEIKTFNDIEVLRKKLRDKQFMQDVKALIFDLAKDAQEASQMNDFEIINDINEIFHTIRIPIFIHSAFASTIEEFNSLGTVWKKDKSGTSIEEIVGIIEKLDDAGFLEAFTPGGFIEKSLFEELHESFTKQFRKGEIEKIIDSIKKSNPEDYKNRATNVFRRIAVKSLNSALLSPVAENDDSVNPIEHFYRRSNKVFAWTGDLWVKKDKSEQVIVLTPRCNLANGSATKLMVCHITKSNLELSGNREKRLRALHNHLTDNLLAKATRYLPSTPLYEGGMVDLNTYETIEKEEFLNAYDYLITLSDDLTNEIIGKFAYYFLRTGITTMNIKEFDSYLELVNQTDDGK